MQKALIVGIDHYVRDPLQGCVDDALAVSELLAKHADGSPNFRCRTLLSSEVAVDAHTLRTAVEELFRGQIARNLFYFAGHGASSAHGGMLVTQDAENATDGLPMRQIHDYLPQASRGTENLVILDCCHSGSFGDLVDSSSGQAALPPGTALLAASRAGEGAEEEGGRGVFTRLLCDGLGGGAADLLGRVTIGSAYAYIDQALGAWRSRPTFKAHLSRFSPLRQCKADLDPAILRLLPTYFETADTVLPLDPGYEPSVPPPDEKKERTFRHLQKLRDVRLLVPVGEQALFYAAVNSKACALTPLGRYYWQLAKDGLI